LNWRPRLSVQETLAWTVEWYRNYYANPAGAQAMTFAQIESFQKRMAQSK
jgi:CDP-glucose 4,6-dehydratase